MIERTEYHRQAMLKHVSCEDVDELLEYMSPAHVIWGRTQQVWGFRGQRKASWHLTPRTFRTDWAQYFESRKGISYRELEERVFVQFAKRADRVGLPVPGFDQFTPEERVECPSDLDDAIWPYRSIWEGLALAQHHQVPTRLLDFTESPYVAAYFAAHEEARDPTESLIAVWAVNLDFVRATSHYTVRSGVFRIDPSRARNRYMLAQRAFFLLDMDIEEQSPHPLDSTIDRYGRNNEMWEVLGASWRTSPLRPPIMLKFTLPGCQAPQLLDRLWDYQISEMHLMPSLDYVRASFKYRRIPI